MTAASRGAIRFAVNEDRRQTVRYIDTSEWVKDGIWSIAPEGCAFMKPGDRASIGDRAIIGAWASIGDRASIGAWARIGAWASIGAGAIIGDRAIIGAGASIGAWASIGAGAIIGDRAIIGADASIGDRASIGAGALDPIDIGHADGYRKCIASVDGVAYIGAGCRWFTLADALKHWGNHDDDRTLTMALMQAAVAIADAKGWSHA